MRGRGRDDPHRVRQDHDEGDPDEFLFKTVKEDNNCKAIGTIDAVQNRTMTLEYEFKVVNDKWKYDHMISDELRRISQQASPSFTNRGGKKRMPIREKLQAER